MGSYLVTSAITYRIGFPLDDAWIHQTYARNLALRGEWAFIPGKPSGGSTAPLWSAFLAVGFWLKLAPYAWAYLLGAAALWGISILGEKTVREMVPLYSPHFPVGGGGDSVGVASGLGGSFGHGNASLCLVGDCRACLVISGSQKYFSLGLLVGLSVWIRPDGITLLGPVVLVLLLVCRPGRNDCGRWLIWDWVLEVCLRFIYFSI